MDSDTSNPAAMAYWNAVDESALEATIRPQAVFADVQIQGTLTGAESQTTVAAPEPAAVSASSGLLAGLDPKWIAVLAIAAIAIGVVAILNSKG